MLKRHAKNCGWRDRSKNEKRKIFDHEDKDKDGNPLIFWDVCYSKHGKKMRFKAGKKDLHETDFVKVGKR